MLAVILVLFLMTNWWLRCYTNHGQVISLEEFVGMPLERAKEKGKKHGFKFEVIDSTYKKNQPKGVIESQDPKPNSPVKENRTIYVTTTKFIPDTVPLPSFNDYDYEYERYKRYLISKDINPVIKDRIFDSRQSNNSILYFYHNGIKITDRDLRSKGYSVSMEDTLYFGVTERTSASVSIPNLVCMQYDAAEFLLSSSNLKVGEVHLDASVTDQTTAYIWRQRPEFRVRRVISVGSQIELFLTQEKPDGCK